MRRALTLIELVLTIGLVGIIGVPTGLLVFEHLHVSLRSRDSNVAMQLARFEMERLDSLNNFFHPDLAQGSTTITNYQGSVYTLTRLVSRQQGNIGSTSPSSQGVKRIEVTVTKPDATNPLARLISYRTKHVAFGS